MFTIYLGNFITFESDNIMDYKEICLRYLGGEENVFQKLLSLLFQSKGSEVLSPCYCGARKTRDAEGFDPKHTAAGR